MSVLTANGDNTVDVLKKIRANFDKDDKITLIWDNVSYHHSNKVVEAAQELNINRLPLPAYSPDFMSLSGAIKSEGDFKKVTQQLHPSIYPNRHLLSLLVALTSVRY